MDVIQTNSSYCGSGKTHDATIAACNGISKGRMTCVAVPSRRLARQVQHDAERQFPELKPRSACFVSNPQRGQPTIRRITKYLQDHQETVKVFVGHHPSGAADDPTGATRRSGT